MSNGNAKTGLVISHLRRELEVLPEGSTTPLRCLMPTSAPPMVTGDRVLFTREAATQERGLVLALLPRTSLLVRRTTHGLRPMCANHEMLLVTIAPTPAPLADLIDRYLLAATLDGVETLFVVNKADTFPAGLRADLAALLAPRRSLGHEVLEVSAHSGFGLDVLRTRIRQRTVVFAGQSGVGKSSLVNTLVPGTGASVQALSAHQQGRHTTSTTRLYQSSEAMIIDSPGIRTFVPVVPDPTTLARGFPEIAAAATRCRFRNCGHQYEPACAVLAAEASGLIDATRLASFRRLLAILSAPKH